MKLYKYCILSLLSCLIACKKEIVVDHVEYRPISFATPSISSNRPDAITVHDTITAVNHEKIIEAGFVFHTPGETPVSVSLKNIPEKAEAISLTYNPKEAFLPSVRYTFNAYVKTNKGFYKGTRREFWIDPILIPEKITKRLALGETFDIEGDFSFLDDSYQIRTDRDNEKIPYTLNTEKNKISVTFTDKDNRIRHGQELIYIIHKLNNTGATIYRKQLATIRAVAVIEEPTKYNYDFMEQIVLKGSAMPSNWAGDLKITIGDASFIYNGSFSFAELLRSIDLKDQKISWGYSNGRDQVKFKNPLTLNPFPAEDIRFQNAVLHPNQSSSISGRSFRTFDYSKVMSMSLDSHPVESFYHSRENERILFYLGAIPAGEYPIKIKTGIFEITSTSKIEIRPFKWDNLVDKALYNGEYLKVNGNFIGNNHYYVRIDDSEEFFVYAKENQLIIPIPQLSLGSHTLQIGHSTHKDGIYYTSKKVSFEIQPPVVESVSHTLSYVGGRIILKGKGLTNISKIYFGEIDMYAWQKIGNDIEVTVISPVKPGIYPIRLVLDGKTISAPGNIEIK